MNPAKNDYFYSSDLALAATLLFWFPLDSIQREGQRATFVFQDTPELQEKVTKFWNGQLKVDPSDYFNKLKTIKTRMYQ